MTEISPTYLKRGDTIGIVSSARSVTIEELKPAILWLKENGLRVVLGKHLFNIYHQMAGTDSDKISDFQTMIDDPSIDAIWCARGGYGTVRIIDSLDFKAFKKHKKWILGYSDITVLHNHIHSQYGIATIHCTMPINIKNPVDSKEKVSNQSLLDALWGKDLQYQLPSHSLNKSGDTSGILVGGNLSILYSLCGSSSDITTHGKILFIEDLDEYLYHIDRMMMNLKRTGKLEGLAGLIVGGMSDMNDNITPYGKQAEQIILEHTHTYNYPIYFGFSAGHIQPNLALRLGLTAHIRDNTLFLPA